MAIAFGSATTGSAADGVASLTIPDPIVSGQNVVIIGVELADVAGTTTVSNITDQTGNAYTRLGRKSASAGSSANVEIWATTSFSVTSTGTITVTPTSSNGAKTGVAMSYTGAGVIGAYVGLFSTSPISTGSTTIATGSWLLAFFGNSAGNVLTATNGSKRAESTLASASDLAGFDSNGAATPVTLSGTFPGGAFSTGGQVELKLPPSDIITVAYQLNVAVQ